MDLHVDSIILQLFELKKLLLPTVNFKPEFQLFYLEEHVALQLVKEGVVSLSFVETS